jgi:hypothetical protein
VLAVDLSHTVCPQSFSVGYITTAGRAHFLAPRKSLEGESNF